MINGRTKSEVIELLSEPFPYELLSWKPQATSGTGDIVKALAATYADPRAYIDRLNEAVGPNGWNDHYDIHPVSGFVKSKFNWSDKTTTTTGPHAKVFVTCSLTIEGLGTKSDGGEADADGDNALTSALSQAFKRACTKFGLGRYLYDLPKDQWCQYDKKKKHFVTTPEMPEWALPAVRCEECNSKIFSAVINDKTYSGAQIVDASRKRYKKALCSVCSVKAGTAAKAAAGKAVQ
jgi:hypothetical protein